SYPTAPHFHQGIGEQEVSGWLAALPESASLSLYLHVPYCRSICAYCGCNTKATLRDEPLASYANCLASEIDLVAARTKARRVTHIHWGGGTPSMLGPARLTKLTRHLSERFDLSGIVEHAIELDPRHVDGPLAETLAAIGVNRVSLGVQDMNRHVQVAIGRVQPPEDVEKTVELLRQAGIAAINIDLMYGLPHQSIDDVCRTVDWAASLDPARLAIFGYAHVPWMKTHQRLIDTAALPGAAERLEQADAARNTLVAADYVAIGLDHFARADDDMAIAMREGRLRRNFQGYTTDSADALLPLGASSIGKFPQGFVQNAPDMAHWSRAIGEGRLPVVRGIAISADDVARAEVIERLMCDLAVDFGALAQAHFGRADAFDQSIAQLDSLARDGVLIRQERRLELTPAGAPFVRLVAAAFDAYLEQSQARHSVAV
ncbi:MAG: oxygen-independent coproporphyrinogen III oxidase, partial [Hyphomicrobiales bacterium]|nr:oxygen-independent coproporphyrinogen III oxidase [Hyphomicrobiales bacterium]